MFDFHRRTDEFVFEAQQIFVLVMLILAAILRSLETELEVMDHGSVHSKIRGVQTEPQ